MNELTFLGVNYPFNSLECKNTLILQTILAFSPNKM